MKIGTPTFRQSLINTLDGFSDLRYQNNLRAEEESRTDGCYSLDFSNSLSFLLNDMCLLDNFMEKRVLIDCYFYNRGEYLKAFNLLRFIEDNMKYRQRDLYYLNHPLWPKVIEMAKEAYDLLMANNHKYNFEEELKEFQKMTPEEVEKHWEERDKHLNS